MLRKEGVTFQRLKTWKASSDPHHAVKKARAGHLYSIADRELTPDAGDPEVIFCVGELGPLLPTSLFEHLAAELSVDDSAQFDEDRRRPDHIS